MNSIITNEIIVENPTPELVWWCQDNLTLKNPDYETLMRIGKEQQARRFPEYIRLYVDKLNTIVIPFGCLNSVWDMISKDKWEIKFNKHPVISCWTDNPTYPLYDYQREAVEKMLTAKGGVLVGNCGAGKTNCGIEILRRIGGRTLWICGKKDLLKQTVARMKSLYPNMKVGTITEGKVNINEVTVSTVQTLAKVDPDLYKDVFDTVIVDECFSGDTEILTNKGFKRFDELKGNEIIAQYENGNISYVNPTRFVRKTVDKYIEWNYKNINIKTTLNHNMVAQSPKGNEIVAPAKDFLEKNYTNYRFITSANINYDKTQRLTDEQRVMIMLQADGCLYHSGKEIDTYKLEFSKERKIKRFKELCENTGISYKEYTKRIFDNEKWTPSSKFTIKMPKNENRYKRLTDFLEQPRNSQYALDILNEIKEWDSYSREDDSIEYDSTIKENVEFVKLCAFMSGVKASNVLEIKRKTNRHKKVYRIYYFKKHNWNYGRFERKVVDKELDTYCVEVPTHKIIVRKDNFIFVCGNCHHCVSEPSKMKMFGKVVNKIAARYKYGLTATPKRNDSLTNSMYALLGCSKEKGFAPVWEIARQETKTLTAEHRRVDLDTPFSYAMLNDDGTFNYNGLVDYIATYEPRNNYIVNNVSELVKTGRKQLVLCARVEQCKLLNDMLIEKGIKSVLLVGKVSGKKRTEILTNPNGWDVIVATTSLAKEGLDVPELDTLHLVSCIANKTDTVQSVGRIERICEGKKEPIVYDYVDNEIPYLVSRYKKRVGWLKRR